ncbi:MAG TPA: SDR family oxidoreductase [Solirubrobacteraceae bacterium]
MSGDLLLTGSTGFVGMELLARALERTDRSVVTLVRAADDDAARARVRGVLDDLFGARAGEFRARVVAVAGDLERPGLGLAQHTREQIAERVTTVVHSAASVSFTLGLAEARAVNVKGTRHVLELAELAADRGDGLDCYGHISTAYVAGNHHGAFPEHAHDLGQGFRNTYEQTKFEAEALVRAAGLPARILRPSIIVGDRRSGWTAAFNVLYWPLRALSRGLFAAIPADPGSPVDAVSVDYVADAAHALCHDPRPVGGRNRVETYHLTAGDHSATLQEVCSQASSYFGRPAPRVLPPAEFARLDAADVARSAALETGRIFFPYFSVGAQFRDDATRSRLAGSGIQVTPLPEYLERLLEFATRARWGKRRIARAEALAV